MNLYLKIISGINLYVDMATHQSFQGSQQIGFGQKLVGAASTMKSIYDIGRGIYHVAKIAAPIISSLL